MNDLLALHDWHTTFENEHVKVESRKNSEGLAEV
jgi:hypothetical protein